jgi:hypothetical protein
VFAKTPAVLRMHTAKSGKSLGSDRGKKIPTSKVKDPLSFEIWIFRTCCLFFLFVFCVFCFFSLRPVSCVTKAANVSVLFDFL